MVRQFWERMGSNDFYSASELLTADFVLEWPQSQERLRGPERFARLNQEYPAHGPWVFTVHRLVASGDQVVTDVGVSDGVQVARAISFFTVRADGICHLLEFWPESYGAPANRAHLVERLDLGAALAGDAVPEAEEGSHPAWLIPEEEPPP